MKWRVEFNGAVLIDGPETEEAAVRAAFQKLSNDGARNILTADGDPELEMIPASTIAFTEEDRLAALAYAEGIVAQYEAEEQAQYPGEKGVAENRQS